MYDSGAELYRAWLAGDGTALERLVGAYSDALVRFAYSYTGETAAAEDVAADAFAVLIVKRKPFSEGARFKTYLYKIARNKALDRLRKNRRQAALPETLRLPLPDGCDYDRTRAAYIGGRLYILTSGGDGLYTAAL